MRERTAQASGQAQPTAAAASADDASRVQEQAPPEQPLAQRQKQPPDILRLVDVQLAHSAATQEQPGYTLPDRRLLIFDVLVRRADGQLIRFRAMGDTGSTGEFISPQAARRGGFELARGAFGHAVEAFGSSTPLTERAVGVQLTFNGELAGSGLSAVHTSSHELTVAPLTGYDILLGTRFLDSVRGVIDVYNRAIVMRDTDGRDIRVQGHGQPARQAHPERRSDATPDNTRSAAATGAATTAAVSETVG